MFRRSWVLGKTSWGVIKGDRELLWLPVLSGIATLIAIVVFVSPVLLTLNETRTATGGTDHSVSAIGWVSIALSYFVLAYIAMYFRTAMICAANERLSGGDPTLRSALAGARRHAGKILPWALVSATVTVVLQAIEQRAGFVGRIITTIVGVAWTLITFLVLPVIVVEGLGVGGAVKKSGSLFKDTWGENMIGNGGIGLVSLVLCIPALVVGFVAIASGLLPIVILGLVLAVAWLGLVATVTSAMTGVYQTALYRYATGQPTGPFSGEALAAAFRPKKGVKAFSRGL